MINVEEAERRMNNYIALNREALMATLITSCPKYWCSSCKDRTEHDVAYHGNGQGALICVQCKEIK